MRNFSKSERQSFYVIKGSAENSRQINRKFGVELLGNSFANLYRSIDNISNFAWVYKEMFWDENSGSLLYQNSTLMFFWKPKIPKNFWLEFGSTYFNWLCLKLEKRHRKGQKRPSNETACPFHSATYSEIFSYFVKFALFKGSFAPGNLEMAKYTWIYIKSGQKIPILTCNTFVDTFLPRALHTRFLFVVLSISSIIG